MSYAREDRGDLQSRDGVKRAGLRRGVALAVHQMMQWACEANVHT
jgi:hypothetical protein